jgi:hypothetical protein
VVAADWMVMPCSRSSSIESILAPTPSLPLTSWIAWIRFGVEEDALGQSSLSSVDVSADSDVSDFIQIRNHGFPNTVCESGDGDPAGRVFRRELNRSSTTAAQNNLLRAENNRTVNRRRLPKFLDADASPRDGIRRR